MDLLTQGLLGATLAQAGAKPQETKLAAGVGFLAGMLADADALIISTHDPLLTLEYHRHFTHALVFIPMGALIAASLLWLIFKKHLSFGRIYLFSFLAYASSGLLDACTSYGTHLLWPFSDERIAWNFISIVDPIFSLGLIIAIIFAIKKLTPLAARIGMVFVISYMLFASFQHERAVIEALSLADSRGHSAEKLTVKPTMANQVLWRSIYEVDGYFYIDAIRIGLFGKPKIYVGQRIAKLNITRDFPHLSEDSILYQDVMRFKVFSSGYTAVHPDEGMIIGDVRYAMLPIGVHPLWGIEIDVEPGHHARFNNYRDTSEETRKAFLAMLLGNDLAVANSAE